MPPEISRDRILHDEIVAARAPWGRRLNAGDTLRIVDLEGRQAVDFLCYDAANPEIRYNAADTMKFSGSLFVEEGAQLMGDMGYPLMTVVADSCGKHDTIGGCCSREGNEFRFGAPNTENCRDNFLKALAPFGLGKRDIVANVNFFMYVPIGADQRMAIVEGLSKPGDHVDLRAETDVIAVLSNCPQVLNPANAFNPTPIQVTVYR